MYRRLITTLLVPFVGTGLVAVQPAVANDDYEKLNGIRTVEVVSIVNTVKTTETRPNNGAIGHAETVFDNRVRDYVVRAIGSRFMVVNSNVAANILLGVNAALSDDASAQITERLKAAPQKPDVDAIVVVYQYASAAVSPGFGYLPNKPLLFGKETIWLSIGYAVGVFDAKTGGRIDYGTGRFRAAGYITGYSPPWASCAASLLPAADTPWSKDQSEHILNEFWALMTRSLPYALLNAGLINDAGVEALKSTAIPDDALCGPVP